MEKLNKFVLSIGYVVFTDISSGVVGKSLVSTNHRRCNPDHFGLV